MALLKPAAHSRDVIDLRSSLVVPTQFTVHETHYTPPAVYLIQTAGEMISTILPADPAIVSPLAGGAGWAQRAFCL
jgi:hypothetical protein